MSRKESLLLQVAVFLALIVQGDVKDLSGLSRHVTRSEKMIVNLKRNYWDSDESLPTALNQEPDFAEPIQNVTVAAGREATLTCTVDNLGTYKVAWIHFDRQTILTVHRHVITRNTRVSIVHNNNHRTWTLHLRNVKETDAGRYMCQINTEPVKTQVGYLTVVVPPDIIDAETSSEVISREGMNVTLTCRAKGSPTPTIMWRREDLKTFSPTKSKSVDEVYGEKLEIIRVSRLHMGAYLCIASNGVPPAVSKRIMLKVDFPPMLWIPHQLVGAPRGYDTTLECTTEAFPHSINYWMREDGEMIFASEKYDTNNTENFYARHMELRIRNLDQNDFGLYKCVAKNPLGETEGSIRVYETEPPTTNPTTTVNAIYDRIEDHTRNRNDNLTGNKNPSSLKVQEEQERDVKYKPSKGRSNKSDENLAIKPPKDWSQSDSAHNSRASHCALPACWSTAIVLQVVLVLNLSRRQVCVS